jgi:hypothetical protein
MAYFPISITIQAEERFFGTVSGLEISKGGECMMKKLIVLFVVIFVVCATQSFAEYDKELVVKVMQANGANMGELKKAIEGKDFFMAAETLMAIAKDMKSLEAVTPPKGSKEEWDANHQLIIDTAFKGIGACGEQDLDKLNEYVGEIGKLIKEGHGMFR